MTTQLNGAVPIPAELRARYAEAGLWDDAPLRDGLEAAAQRAPGRVAIADRETSWTYAELERSVARGVARLRREGVLPGAAVLVVAPLIASAVCAYHAIIRAGGVAMFLDRRCGPADVQHAAGLPGVALVVSTTALAGKLGLADTGRPFITFDELLAGPAASRDWPEPDPSAVAAVVFTSGTTSTPKGVAHSLNTLRAGARNMALALGLTEADVAFLATPLASITGFVQVHLTLDRGAGLVLEDRFEPAESLARLRANGSTVLGGAPVIVEELFREAAARNVRRLPLRAICLGGTMIPREVLELAVDRYGITPVRVYGSSEVPCATGTLPADEGEARVRDDGACCPGTEVRTDGEVPGELLVRGPMRFLGYLGAGHNDGAFTPGGWYRTGDLARLADGRLTVTGRLTEVVARKGLKISLAEVDLAAGSLAGVEEVAAYAVPDEETGERLALALRVHDPDSVEFEQVIDQLLGAGLARWKLPEQIVVWESPLPRTASGKIQRRLVAEDAGPRRTLLAPRLTGGRPARRGR